MTINYIFSDYIDKFLGIFLVHMWALVRSWIGFSAVDAYTLPAHFVQFTY
jgi:hypothetical protein